MRIIDRYIAGSFLAVFGGSLAAVSFLFTVISILDSLNYLMTKKGASFFEIIHYYALQLPQTIYMTTPLAALLSVMIVLGAMNQKNELTAIRAGGVSMARAAAPVLLSSVFIGVLLFILGNTLVPVGNRHFLSARQKIKNKEPEAQDRLWYVSESRQRGPSILRIEGVDRETGRLMGLTLFETGPGLTLEREIVAESADYKDGRWVATDARTVEFKGLDAPHFEKRESIALDIPDSAQDLLRIQRAPAEMTLSELSSQIERVYRYGLSDTGYRVELHARFAIPFAALILVMVGAPLAIRPVRAGGLALSILGAVGVGFAYFVIIAFMMSLGRGGIVPPWAAAWSANMVFGALGALLFSGMRK